MKWLYRRSGMHDLIFFLTLTLLKRRRVKYEQLVMVIERIWVELIVKIIQVMITKSMDHPVRGWFVFHKYAFGIIARLNSFYYLLGISLLWSYCFKRETRSKFSKSVNPSILKNITAKHKTNSYFVSWMLICWNWSNFYWRD